jgi:diadenosine tetraphosphatase ApaH/serine/threonine PP2A family protein phosphatase
MRIALLADIHANREAFEAVLARLESCDIDRIALLGDLVGYGPDPAFCVEKAARLIEKGALAVLGNHDAAIADGAADMNAIAREAIDWTREQLDDQHKAVLAALPESQSEGDALFVHATARNPLAWEYVTGPQQAERSLRATSARITLVGHVHAPHLWRLTSAGTATGHIPMVGVEVPLAASQVWLGVMGAVGQPRDGKNAAAFGILDLARRTLTFERQPYDYFTTCRKVRDAGLPEALAARLTRGR